MALRDLRQGHKEFGARVKRVQKTHAGYGMMARPAQGQRPYLAATIGFVWFYLILRLSQNRPLIAESVSQGSLGRDFGLYIQGAVAVLIVASVVGALYLAFRATRPHPKRLTFGSISAGVGLALAYTYMPDSVFSFGYELLDDNTRLMLASANGSVTEWGLENIQVVSSWVPEIAQD